MSRGPTDWLVAPTLRLNQGEGLAEALRCLREFDPRVFLIFGGDAEDVAWLHETLEEQAEHPILFAADLERGAYQQFEGLTPLPDAWALGQLGAEACYDSGHRTAAEAATAHVRWIFGPCVDLHRTGPGAVNSPIIANRAFGGDPMRVIESARAWTQGLQDAGGLACAKHFPGHGGCPQDSHTEHAVSFEELTEHLVPYRELLSMMPSVMIGHIEFPLFDDEGLPATRSPKLMSILREELGYDGVAVTDSLRMSGFGDGPEEEMAVESLHAGVDLLLDPSDPVALALSLRDAMSRGDLAASVVEKAAMRVDRLIRQALDTPAQPPRPLVLGAGTKRLLRPLAGGKPGRGQATAPRLALALASVPDADRFLEEWGVTVLGRDEPPPSPLPDSVLVLCGAREGHGLPQLPGDWMDALARERPTVYVAGAPDAFDLPPASTKGYHLPGLSPALLALLFAAGEE